MRPPCRSLMLVVPWCVCSKNFIHLRTLRHYGSQLITGSSAGLSRVNSVRRSSAKTWNFYPSPSHNFISIDLTFCVSDYVREITSPVKFGSDPMSGRDATWGQQIRVLWLFVLFFYSSTELQPLPVNQLSRTIAQKTRSGVRKTLLGMSNV